MIYHLGGKLITWPCSIGVNVDGSRFRCLKAECCVGGNLKEWLISKKQNFDIYDIFNQVKPFWHAKCCLMCMHGFVHSCWKHYSTFIAEVSTIMT